MKPIWQLGMSKPNKNIQMVLFQVLINVNLESALPKKVNGYTCQILDKIEKISPLPEKERFQPLIKPQWRVSKNLSRVKTTKFVGRTIVFKFLPRLKKM